MSIELMERALEFITGVYFGEHEGSRADREKLEADLTTAIQQAEAQTDESASKRDEILAWLRKEAEKEDYFGRKHIAEKLDGAANLIERTHPAPSVPDEVVHLRNALILAANRLDRLTLELKYDSQARADAIEWASDAMLAAKDTK